MFREVGRGGLAGAESHTKAHDKEKSKKAADGDFDDEGHGSGLFGGGGAGFLGDLVEILEIVHGIIITQVVSSFGKTGRVILRVGF